MLVLTLKRFAQRSNAGGLFARFRSASKNSTAVTVTDALDLTPYCSPHGARSQVQTGCNGGAGPVYQLLAISNHSGTLEGGHYTATARSAADNSWYHFNDSSVRRDNKPNGPSSTAYVLMYRLSCV